MGRRVGDQLPSRPSGYCAEMTRGFAVAAMIVAATSAAAQQPAPSVCSGAAHHQFDFWVGEWSVTDRPSGQPAGVSQIEQIYGGCVIRENWAEEGFRGGSLNSYWATDKQWHQTWMDSAGAFRHFIGGVGLQSRGGVTPPQPHPSGRGKNPPLPPSFTSKKEGTGRQIFHYFRRDAAPLE